MAFGPADGSAPCPGSAWCGKLGERPAETTAWPETAITGLPAMASHPTRDDFAAMLDETLGGAAN
ncbi:MAG: hypothetical protein K2X68_05690, partial [Novosphingobium sp.]|nr:hypothetical protein [Novosphingobium sp.]